MRPGVGSASKKEYQINPEGKGGRCVRLITYHLHVPMSRNLGALTSWNPVGLFRPVMGQLYYCCIIIIIIVVYTGFWWEDLMEKDHLEYLDVEERIILNWIFKKWNRET
jgi:hypothetical protein